MVWAMQIKWMKGCFVFRPLYFVIGAICLYVVYYMDQWGALTLLPQVFLGIIGGRVLIMGVYERNPKKLRKYLSRG